MAIIKPKVYINKKINLKAWDEIQTGFNKFISGRIIGNDKLVAEFEKYLNYTK